MNLTWPFDSKKKAFTTSKISDFKHSGICKQVWTMPTEDKKFKNQKNTKFWKSRGLEKTYLAPLPEGCWQSGSEEAPLPANCLQAVAPLLAIYAMVEPLIYHCTSMVPRKYLKHNKEGKTKLNLWQTSIKSDELAVIKSIEIQDDSDMNRSDDIKPKPN